MTHLLIDVDAEQCVEHLERCCAQLAKAQARAREDDKYRFHLAAAERHLARARAAYGAPVPHQRKARMARTVIDGCSEALAAFGTGGSVRECGKIIAAAVRGLERLRRDP